VEDMKEHFCPVEQAVISFEVECNWCGEKHMNTEDSEFNRIELELKIRLAQVEFALQRLREPSPIPLITDEEWEALNEEE